MKIANVQINQAESFGRRSLGALSAVDKAQQAKKRAGANIAEATLDIAKDYLNTRLDMNADENVSEAMDSLTEFKKNNQETQFYDAEDLKDLNLEGVRLYDPGNDDTGKEVEHLRKNIPAYEVYPALLDQKIKGVAETYSEKIISPKHRAKFDESMEKYYRDQTLQALTQAQKSQVKQEKIDTQKRAQSYAMDGNKQAALEQLKLFKGSDKEKADLLTDINQESEKNGYREAIRTEDVPKMQSALKNLTEQGYKERGDLTTDQNLTEQAKLNAKLGQLKARSGTYTKQYRAGVQQTANDTISSLDDGILEGVNNIKVLTTELSRLGLDDLALKVERSAKSAPVVVGMYQTNPANYPAMIDQYTNKVASGVEKTAIRADLIEKSEAVEARLSKDATGVYVERIIGNDKLPPIGGDSYFAEMLNYSKQASDLYQMDTQPLPDMVANQLADKLKNQTIKEKLLVIEQVAGQVRTKADQDKLFKQLDSNGAGNMNVYADIMDRGEGATIETIDAGQALRRDKSMKLLHTDIDALTNAQLFTAFPLESQRRGYVEAVKDYYAKAAADAGKFNPDRTDKGILSESIKAVVGNVVSYEGRSLLLPDNDIDARGFSRWIRGTSGKYLDDLGGVYMFDSNDVMEQLRLGNYQLRQTTVRGEYAIVNEQGNFFASKEDPTKNFILRYEKVRPTRRVGRSPARDRSRN